MRWNALSPFACVLALVFAGCGSSGSKKDAPAQSSLDTADLFASVPMEQPAGQPEPYVDYSLPSEPAERTPEADAYLTGSTTSPSPRYHIVAKKDTLYGLARAYYGEARRWKDIYEANSSDIRDPNLIKVGQRLVIP